VKAFRMVLVRWSILAIAMVVSPVCIASASASSRTESVGSLTAYLDGVVSTSSGITSGSTFRHVAINATMLSVVVVVDSGAKTWAYFNVSPTPEGVRFLSKPGADFVTGWGFAHWVSNRWVLGPFAGSTEGFSTGELACNSATAPLMPASVWKYFATLKSSGTIIICG
jgi:hypothetical protein